MADPDLESMSVEDLLALKQQAAPVATATPAAVGTPSIADLDSLSVDELLKLKNSSVNKDWNVVDSAKNFGSGVVEGTAGMLGLAADLNPWGHIPDLSFPATKMIHENLDPLLAEKDPQYRYARTIGNFAAPIPIKGANTIKSLLTSVVSGLGAQGLEDVTGDKKIAPLVGAVGAGGAAEAALGLGALLKRVFVGATKEEIAGSAAKTFAERTGLTTEDLATANQGPKNLLEDLQTTAELTGNSGAAQIEKTLAATGDNANIYNALDQKRTAAREAIVDAGSTVPSVNKEGLGDTLINTAEEVQGKMANNSKAFWEGVPRDEVIPVTESQAYLTDLLGSRQAGLPINPKVENLVSQVAHDEKGALTSGALQDIRSDALSLMRDKDLTGFEKKLLTGLSENIDSSMAKGLSDESYDIWKAARQSTAAEKSSFGRGTAGAYLLSDNARTASVLDKVFKGDTQAVTELKTAIGESPEVLEQVKRGVMDMIPRNAQGELTPNGMKKFLSANEGGLKELFGDAHYSNLKRVYEDLKSQAGVKDLAFLASKGNSATAQRGTVAGALQDAITESLVPGVGGRFSGIIDAVKNGAGIKDAKSVEELLFKAALDPKFAEQLSKTPTNRRIFNALESLNNIKNDVLKTAGTGAVKELDRDQDNRSPMAKLLDKVTGDKATTPAASLAARVVNTPNLTQPTIGSDMARSPEFDAKVGKIAANLDTDPKHLLKAISFETGGTFDPTVKNKAGSSGTGLIQFMGSTAKDLTGADTKAAALKILSGMSATDQLDYVEKYLKPFKGKLKSVDDVYMAILWPKAVGKDSDYSLFKKGTEAYWMNRGLDLNKDGVITKSEAASKVKAVEV